MTRPTDLAAALGRDNNRTGTSPSSVTGDHYFESYCLFLPTELVFGISFGSLSILGAGGEWVAS